jgi:hypothetical protein
MQLVVHLCVLHSCTEDLQHQKYESFSIIQANVPENGQTRYWIRYGDEPPVWEGVRGNDGQTIWQLQNDLDLELVFKGLTLLCLIWNV